MKKTISVALSILLTFSFAVTAFAESAPQYTETTLENMTSQQMSDDDMLHGEMGIVPAPDDFDALIDTRDYHTGDYNLAVNLLKSAGVEPDYFVEYLLDNSYYYNRCYYWPVNSENVFFWTEETPRRLIGIETGELALSGTQDLSTASELKYLDISYASDLTGVILPAGNNLKYVDLWDCGIKEIDVSVAPMLEHLAVTYCNIKSLDVTKNTELTYLSAGDYGGKSIDISKNTKLQHLDLNGSDLTSIDVSHLKDLTYLDLEYCWDIESLDVTQNTKLVELLISSTGIDAIDLSNNTQLERFAGSYTNISQIDFLAHPKLKQLQLYDMPLGDVDVTFLEDLWLLNYNGNIDSILFKLTQPEGGSLEVTCNTSSGYFYLYAYPDEGYLFSNWTGLPEDVDASLTEVSFPVPETKPEISGVFTADPDYDPDEGGSEGGGESGSEGTGKLDDLDTSIYEADDFATAMALVETLGLKDQTAFFEDAWYCSSDVEFHWNEQTPRKLSLLICYNAGLEGVVDLTALDGLKYVELASNSDLTDVKLNKNAPLRNIFLADTAITAFDPTPFAKLEELDLDDLTITSIDLSKNPLLESLDLEDCKNITSLDISKNPELTFLDLEGTSLSKLDISNNPALENIGIDDTAIDKLDVSHLEYLEILNISNSRITSIDLSGCPALTKINAAKTKIQTLDLSKNHFIYSISIDNSDIASLTLPEGDDIEYLYMEYCKIPSFDFSKYNLTEWAASCDAKCDGFEIKQPADGTILAECYGNEMVLTSRGSNGKTVKRWIGAPVSEEDIGRPYIYFLTNDASGVITAEFTDDNMTRIKGKTRYETCFAIADQYVAVIGEKADNIIVASGNNFADALAASYLAAYKNAPILMASGTNDAELIAQIAKTMKEGGTVYIAGGEAAVPASTEDALKAAGLDVKRLKGKDRYLTNLAILAEGDVQYEIIVATGRDYADSLSASGTGFPILLVDGKANSLNDAQREFLAGLDLSYITIVGGEAAVSKGIEKELAKYGYVNRVKGKDRYETSTAIADYFFYQPHTAIMAYGHNFPDGLCGGPLAYAYGAPVILTRTENYSAASKYINDERIDNAFVLGGEILISDEAVKDILVP